MEVSPRSRARVLVISALYQLDLLGRTPAEAVREIRRQVDDDPESLYYLPERGRQDALDFFEQLLEGTWQARSEIDAALSENLTNWTLDRVGAMERAILRLGCFELLHREDIPANVTLNEMVELSKSFCDIKSKDLVNGVLDAVASK